MLAVVESSCLLDTWAIATTLVDAVTRHPPDPSRDVRGALRTLTAESARGADPRALHRAVWGLLDAAEHEAVGCSTVVRSLWRFRRDDLLGRAACRAVEAHRRAGDRVVVVSDLVPALAAPLADALGVSRVVCGAPTLELARRWPGAVPDVLLGAAAARALEQVAAEEGYPLARCVAYGRDPRDRDLLRAAGRAVGLCYGGHLHRVLDPDGNGAACAGPIVDDVIPAARVASAAAGRPVVRERADDPVLLPAGGGRRAS